MKEKRELARKEAARQRVQEEIDARKVGACVYGCVHYVCELETMTNCC